MILHLLVHYFLQLTLSPLKNVGLRLFQCIFGKFPAISQKVKELLRDTLISPKKKTKYTYSRIFVIRKNGITVYDQTIGLPHALKTINTKFPLQYVPSARFFIKNDLQLDPLTIKNQSSKRELS